jgi:mRNA interferase RelE/StbE
MEVFITPNAKKQIKKIPKFIQLSVINKLRILKNDPITGAIKLSGYDNAYRVRIGNYRIVYMIKDANIYVVHVAHRKEVYLLLKRSGI